MFWSVLCEAEDLSKARTLPRSAERGEFDPVFWNCAELNPEFRGSAREPEGVTPQMVRRQLGLIGLTGVRPLSGVGPDRP